MEEQPPSQPRASLGVSAYKQPPLPVSSTRRYVSSYVPCPPALTWLIAVVAAPSQLVHSTFI